MELCNYTHKRTKALSAYENPPRPIIKSNPAKLIKQKKGTNIFLVPTMSSTMDYILDIVKYTNTNSRSFHQELKNHLGDWA